MKEKKEIITFKIRILKITKDSIIFKLYSGKEYVQEHSLNSEEIILRHEEFRVFVLRLVAFVYIEKKTTKKEKELLSKLKIIVFDGDDFNKSNPINLKKINN